MARNTSREIFLEAVITEVAECGLENLRTKNIAVRAGYSEAMMFRYFSSKDEMLQKAFLVVDHRVSSIISSGAYLKRLRESGSDEAFAAIAHEAWQAVFHYLLEHPSDTLYLLRFRYCALYNEEIRSQRQAYSGAFDEIYSVLQTRFGAPVNTSRGFVLNYSFDLTLCLAEKIVSGRIKFTQEVEERLWATIRAAVLTITQMH